MPMLSLLLSLALQDDIIGWRCTAEQTVADHVYRLEQSVEEDQRSPRDFRISWLSGPFVVARFIGWLDVDGMPPGPPRTINFRVSVSGRVSRPLLRLAAADGTGQLLSDMPSRWTIQTSPGEVHFQSLDPALNRSLWIARSFTAIVEDRRGRVLGRLEIRFPDPAEVTAIAAALEPEVDAKLRDPANPANRCTSYGSEAYIDPV